MIRITQAIALTIVSLAALGTNFASAQGISTDSLQISGPSDHAFDFEVYMAEDVEPVYFVKVCRENGTWEYIVEYNYNSALQTSTPGSRLEWDSFSAARRYGQRLKDRGEATAFIVVEHWPEPNWQLVETVGTMQEAEFLADFIESNFGMMTDIKWFQTGNDWVWRP